MVDSPTHRDSPRASEQELADAIIAYLTECPHAMDTVEGIARWWVLRQRIRIEVEKVASVLQRLAAEGFLEEIRIGGNRGYRLDASRHPSLDREDLQIGG